MEETIDIKNWGHDFLLGSQGVGQIVVAYLQLLPACGSKMLQQVWLKKLSSNNRSLAAVSTTLV